MIDWLMQDKFASKVTVAMLGGLLAAISIIVFANVIGVFVDLSDRSDRE